ncbi:MAG: hypothetical protein SVU94_06810 [Bacteroidota bacterium]|nr:hypothetical protein [Bacteroidota bacterium]
MYRLSIILVTLLFLVSCNISKEREKHITNENLIIGKVFSFPDSVEIFENDILYLESSNKFLMNVNSKPIILSIIWGDCAVCVEKLYEWSSLISSGTFGDKVVFQFVILAHDKKYYLRTHYVPLDNIHRLIIDSNEDFFKVNNIKNNPGYNTFLLDENRVVQLQGSPIIFDELIEDYKDKIDEIKFKI